MIKKALATILLLPALTNAAPTAKAYALTNGTVTHRNLPTAFASRHIVTIKNDAVSAHTFTVTISLCPDAQPDRCRKEFYNYTLAKSQTFTKEYLIKTTLMFPRVGTKTLTATTQVTGSANAIANDYKYVEVFF